MNAPERIWVDGDATGSKQHFDWDWDSGCLGHQQERYGELEYIRRDPDVLAALPEIKALVEEAYNKGWNEAIEAEKIDNNA